MRAGTRGAHPTPRCCGPSHSCTLSPPAPAPPFSQGHGCRPLRPISRGLVEMPPSPSGGCGAWGPHHTSLCSPKASRTVMCFIQSENKHYFFRAPVSPPFQSHPPTGRGGEWGGDVGVSPIAWQQHPCTTTSPQCPPAPHKGPSVHHVQLSHAAPQIPEPGRISGEGGLGLGFGGQQLLKPWGGW